MMRQGVGDLPLPAGSYNEDVNNWTSIYYNTTPFIATQSGPIPPANGWQQLPARQTFNQILPAQLLHPLKSWHTFAPTNFDWFM